MATKKTQLDSASVTIDGKDYYLKEPPSRDSSLVLKMKKEHEEILDIKRTSNILEMISGYVRMARYAVNGTAGFERDVDKILADVATALHEANQDLDDIARNIVLNWFVDGVMFFFLEEESIAWVRFGKSTNSLEWIEKKVASRIDSLQCLSCLCNATFMQSQEKLFSRPDNVSFALTAQSGLMSEIQSYQNFWENLKRRIKCIGGCRLVETLEKLRKDDEETKKLKINSIAMKREIVTYYARWVALQQLCSSLHEWLQSKESKLLSNLADRPSSEEEARRELPKIRKELDDKKRKGIN